MKAHPDIKIIANGDSAQNAPVGQKLAVNFDGYYVKVLAQMFPRRLDLVIPKRYTDEDSQKMQELYGKLLNHNDNKNARIPNVSPFTIASKYLKTIDWEDLKKDSSTALHSHIAFTNDSVDRVNYWAQDIIGQGNHDYCVGDEVVGKTYAVVAGKRKINTNTMYTVREVLEKHLIIVDSDGNERKLSRASSAKLLRRPWCRTGHSMQGRTIGDKLYIHDANTWMASARWLRTAITRCRTLDIILVTYVDPLRVPERVVQQRIRNHKNEDARKQRTLTPDEYVTFEWAQQEIKLQNYTCAVCQSPLDKDWSIDRKDNARAHTKQNCQISCRNCQHASSHR